MAPLHLANKFKNNRSIDMLLKYMSKLNFNSTRTFKNILPELIDFSNFNEYLEKLTFRSVQMLNKQTLRINQDQFYSKQISLVSINHACTSYIDTDYYQVMFNEIDLEDEEDVGTWNSKFYDGNSKVYPVNVQGFSV